MNKLLLIISLVILVVIASYYYFYNISKKITFSFSVDQIDLSQFNVLGLLSQGNAPLTGIISLSIKNDSNVSISISNLNAIIYYNSQIVAQSTSNPINTARVSIPSMQTSSFQHELSVNVNSNTIDLVNQIKSKNKVSIQYSVFAMILGLIPYKITGVQNFN